MTWGEVALLLLAFSIGFSVRGILESLLGREPRRPR